MKKNVFVGKTRDEVVNNAMIELQELEDNLIIKDLETTKTGLFKSKKVEIEVVEKREVITFIKEQLHKLLKDLGFNANIEVKSKDEIPTYIIYSDNDSLIIGKNGKNLQALSIVMSGVLKKELGLSFKFLIDVNDYKEKHQRNIEYLAKKIAREVALTKVEVKMDSMNSYERRLVHNVLTNNKKVYTESIGEEPNRCVVVKARED